MGVRSSVRTSVNMYDYLNFMISITAKPIGLYFLENIPSGPVMVLSYFVGVWNTLTTPKKKKLSYYFLLKNNYFCTSCGAASFIKKK